MARIRREYVDRRQLHRVQAQRPVANLTGRREQSLEREPHGQVGDDAGNGRGDARQGRGWPWPTADVLRVGRAGEDERERWHESDPRDQQSADHAGDERVNAGRRAEGGQEGHELDDHDQRPGRALGEAQSVDHLACGQPAVNVDGLLGDEREDCVGAAERDHRGKREEDGELGEDARGAENDQNGHGRRQPDHQCRQPELPANDAPAGAALAGRPSRRARASHAGSGGPAAQRRQ